jgi:indolepyruvate ferredoxin oxidoreductase beta subunit
MTIDVTNVLLAGVGGQGVLVASELMALAALEQGLQAKQSEVHGVAQRGGSVVSHVRFGSRVYSPLIRCGEVDILYAGEQLEALRYAHYLKDRAPIVASDQTLKPIHLPGEPERKYPEDILGFLAGKGYEARFVPALHMALELGDKRCANVVLLGCLSPRVSLTLDAWRAAIDRRFPEKLRALNHAAFDRGRAWSEDDSQIRKTG